jgi:fibronectin-binding autotransporter adhesin
MMKRSIRFGSLVLVLPLLALALAGTANAGLLYWSGDGTWDGATVNWGIASGGTYDQSAWIAASDAVFEGTLGTVTVDTVTPPGSVNSMTFTTSGYILNGGTLTMTGTSKITTAGTGTTQTINSAVTSAAGLTVEGSGTLNLGGLGTMSGGYFVVGNSSANNTLNVANGGRVLYSQKQSLQIGAGAAANGGNVLNVSTPGSSAAPTIRVGPTDIGLSSSNNELNISNGAYYARHTYNGQGAWTIGQNAGADNNRIIITGTDASGNPSTADQLFEPGLRQFIKVGMAGSGNYIKAEAGGRLTAIRLNIAGEGAGDNNYVLITGKSSITGTPSTFYGADAQFIFQVGTVAGATGNSFRVEDGATGSISGQNDNRRAYTIGAGNGADNNYLRVTGTGSALSLQHKNPITIGGIVTGGGSSITDYNTVGNAATGNHLDVYSGGSLTLDATTSLYVMGVDSAFNLGDGSGISTASVGTNGGVIVPGVYLKNASGRLNINSGRLTARAAGALVSGAGKVQLTGPATFDTSTFTNSIDTLIEGTVVGTLIKQGGGTLTLSQANTYLGDTQVDVGTLSISNAYLADASTVKIATSAFMDLNFTGIDTVGAVWLGGSNMGGGTFNATTQPTYFTGGGSLYVVPEPATMAFVVLGGLGLLARRRRRA